MSQSVQAKLNQIKSLIELEPYLHSISDLSDNFDISEITIKNKIDSSFLKTKTFGNPELWKIKGFIKNNSHLTAAQIGRELKLNPVYISNLATRIGVVLANRGRKRVDSDPKFFNYLIHGLAY